MLLWVVGICQELLWSLPYKTNNNNIIKQTNNIKYSSNRHVSGKVLIDGCVYNLLFGFFRLFWYRGWSDGRRQTPLWHRKKNAPGPRIPAISKANETKESLSEKRRRDYQIKRTRSKKWKNIRGYSNARVLQRYYLLFLKTRVISIRSEVLEKKTKWNETKQRSTGRLLLTALLSWNKK